MFPKKTLFRRSLISSDWRTEFSWQPAGGALSQQARCEWVMDKGCVQRAPPPWSPCHLLQELLQFLCSAVMWVNVWLQVRDERRAQEVFDLADYERSEELRKAKSRSKKNHSRFTVLRRRQTGNTVSLHTTTTLGVQLEFNWSSTGVWSELNLKFSWGVLLHFKWSLTGIKLGITIKFS